MADESDNSDFESDFEDDKEAIAIQQMLQKTKTKSYIEQINDSIISFLQKTRYSYCIIGGRAVQGWLDLENKELTAQEKIFLNTKDWDIIVNGDNEISNRFIIELHAYIKKETKINLDTRFDNILISNKEGVYIYQIGVYENRSTEWIVDVHAENIDINKIIKINGLIYPKLDVLIEQLENNIWSEKALKRATRLTLLEKALNNIKLFKPEIYRKIIENCHDREVEQITGKKLNCGIITN